MTYRIFGSELSPYSVKVRSYFRYRGIPHQWVLRNAASQPDDILVIGAGRRGPLAHAVACRVSRYCLAHAKCLVLAVPRDASLIENPTDEERRYLAELATFLKEETGYQWIQGTRPQTLSFGLTDSPSGLAAWIVEKFRAWSDCGGDVERAISRDRMLADISLYWFSGAIGSSFWPYYERMHGPWPIPHGEHVTVPMGYAEFPREILKPPRITAERVYKNIRRWSVMEKGGHFVALEQPELLAEEVRAFFRELR